MYFAIITSSHILQVTFFYQQMVVFLFNIVIYVLLLKQSMYSCILIFRPCILNVSMYSYCCLCILIVRPCILIFVYVYLLLFMYS